MQCKYCEGENPENAVFCASCGKRLDGKKNCPSCNTEVGESDNFCPTCGTSLTGETNEGNSRAVSVWTVIGGTIALVGAVLAAVFAFVIGFAGRGIPYFDYSGLTLNTWDISIWDFFGERYTDIADFLKTPAEYAKEYSSDFAFSLYFGTAMGTVISVITLLCSAGFAITALVGFKGYVTGKNTKLFERCSALAMISYLAGLLGFWALFYVNGGEFFFTSTTIAGIVICSSALAISFVCRLIQRGRKLFEGSKFSFALGLCSLFLLIAAAVAAGGSASVVKIIKPRYPSYQISLSYMLLTQGLTRGTETSDPLPDITALGAITTALQILLIATAAVAVFLAMTGGEKKKGRFVFAIVTTVLSIAYMICAILFDGKVEDHIVQPNIEYSVGSLSAIAVTVICFINLAVMIWELLLKKRAAKGEPQAE